jgi:hypothetical protein
MRITSLVLFLLIGLSPARVWAEDESGLYVELEAMAYSHRVRSDSFESVRGYFELPLGDSDWSAYATVYSDGYFRSSYFGLTRYLGDFQVALATGPASYDGQIRTTYNSFVWYNTDEVEVLAEAEYYDGDSHPWFFRGYAYKKNEKFFYGVYGETYSGTGPAAGFNFFAGKVKPWVSIPLYDPEDSEIKIVFGITMILEWEESYENKRH